MPASALSRAARALCRAGLACSCARTSGEAFTSAQRGLSEPHTAIEDWVRACVRNVPSRTPEQLRQLQFHWGKPPPAADPRTRILTAPSPDELGERPPRPPARGAQRRAMYRVISMPKRRSIACGTSQRMFLSPRNTAKKIPDKGREAKLDLGTGGSGRPAGGTRGSGAG